MAARGRARVPHRLVRGIAGHADPGAVRDPHRWQSASKPPQRDAGRERARHRVHRRGAPVHTTGRGLWLRASAAVVLCLPRGRHRDLPVAGGAREASFHEYRHHGPENDSTGGIRGLIPRIPVIEIKSGRITFPTLGVAPSNGTSEVPHMQVIPIIWPILLCAFLAGVLLAWVLFVALPRLRRARKSARLGPGTAP